MQISVTIYIIFIFAFFSGSAANSTDNDDSLLPATLTKNISFFSSAYDAWDAGLLLDAYGQFRIMEQEYPRNHLPSYWQAVVQFHLVSYRLFGLPEHQDKNAAKKHVEKALQSLSTSLELQPGDAESLALLGTLTGIKIFLKPLLAPVLGPRVMSAIKEALSADSTNPRVHYLVGVSYYNTPALMGGGVDKGLEYLLKAESFYKREAAQPVHVTAPRWGRSTTIGFIAKAYAKKKEYKKARTWYQKALAVNPSDKMAQMGLSKLNEHTY